MGLAYWVVDAFTDRLFSGNPAAVLLPDAALPDALMQSIAAENNLSETAFAVPEGDGFRLRWFTPTIEVDLCGHATLATAFVLGRQRGAGVYRFETRSGRLEATVDGGRVVLDFPARRFVEAPVPEGWAEALGAPVVKALRSADWIAVLESSEAVRGLRPDFTRVRALEGGTIIVTASGGNGADITSRYFAPAYGIDEDPVTGSLHTQVAPYWAGVLGKTRLVCDQASARGGRMVCELRGDRVMMEGSAVLYAQGELLLK